MPAESISQRIKEPLERAIRREKVSAESITLDNHAKRLFDITFAIVSIVLSSPVLLLALLVVALESPGNPIFVQKRVGKNGRIFDIYKLRTMYQGMVSDNDGFRTAKGDSRLTKSGFILRATNIDELPQLFNILKGDMSLIGPRPLSVDETEYIASHLNIGEHYPGFRPAVRPGLVGLEQVNRTRDLTYLERFQYNHVYETQWTPDLDCRIFLKALIICRHVCFAAIAGSIVVISLLILSTQNLGH